MMTMIFIMEEEAVRLVVEYLWAEASVDVEAEALEEAALEEVISAVEVPEVSSDRFCIINESVRFY